MEIKLAEMSNSELLQYKITKENEYESIKNKIDSLCDELQKVEKEYLKADNELKIRSGKLY